MALTIRTIDKDTRKILDQFKDDYEIKTDSKALLIALDMGVQAMNENITLKVNQQKLLDELVRIKQTISQLEHFMVQSIEILKQPDLELY